ncbi:hypothetical protein CDG81_09585 [Actinopolyspora erythraea]|uniref:Site-specific integrase n=1 Tax=Actinopolyspora erythraea TaxID=414996 RepID=A0A099D8G4_9ACTN|nr:tyrosine-type recombinase/integrase [Actinopolyspora erythraea]ASU78488.1 hypothetical protein CDG81_09585 [Actinopolyspora erythraea]KGI82067.1 hypothetical protein IL38_07060 [Actinopolyspora erythraea]
MATVFKKCKKGKDPCTDSKCKHPWTVRYREPGGRSGKQREASFERKKSADAFKTKVENEKNEGTYLNPDRGKITVKDWAEHWLSSRPVGELTKVGYESFITTHVIPLLGKKPLRSVTRSDIQKFVSQLSAEMSPTTVANRKVVLSAIFNDAVKDDRIPSNPCRGVPTPRTRENKLDLDRIPSLDEIVEISEKLPDRLQLTVWLMAGAGLRVAEALAVSEETVRDGYLRLRWQVQLRKDSTGKKVPTLVPLKHRAEGDYRDVPIPHSLQENISSHIERFGTLDGQLFFNKNDLVTYASYRGLWVYRESRYTPHDLRHWFASTALAGDVSLLEVSRWLGHKSIQETADTYGHLVYDSPDRLRSVMQSALA